MKAQNWRLILAGALALAGAAVRFLCFGYTFTAYLLWGLCALVLLTDGLLRLRKQHRKLANGCLIALAVLIGLGLAAAGITEGFIIAGAKTDASPEAPYAVVLGAGVNGTVPSRSLRERLDAAAAYLQEYPDAVCIVSGGQGAGEDITEAQCMLDYLTAHGIEEERVWMEERAASTEENLAFSVALIAEKTGKAPERIALISSEYHLFRAKEYAKRLGVEAVGYAAETGSPLYMVNSFLREIPAVWKMLLLD